MTAKHVRIDAYLHPCKPPMPEDVVVFETLLSEGFYDDLHPRDLDAAINRVMRVKQLEEANFNVILNRALLAYGLHVTNVATDQPQSALAYGQGYTMDECLYQALDMRSWFLPAVRSLYVRGEAPSLSDLVPA